MRVEQAGDGRRRRSWNGLGTPPPGKILADVETCLVRSTNE